MGAHIEENNRYFLYIKGADNQMIEIAEKESGEFNVPKQDFSELEESLGSFSEKGLRTLLLGYRELQQAEVEDFGHRWKAWKTITNKEEKKRAEAQCIRRMERDITIVGATGVEDQLQDEVPETLESIQRGGIKIWVLTGDKVET